MPHETIRPGHGDRTPAERDILAVVPERGHDLARLRMLADGGRAPVVTVVGKYNHGKSRLLNELIGADAFPVADRRETVAMAERRHRGVRWLDAPGLDADVDSGDDHHARQAAWLESDIRLVVHAAKEGELDADEQALLRALLADGERTRRQTLFVLSQVDQLADDAAQESVARAIGAQVPGVVLHPVSAARHRKGVDEGKRLMIERSGIPALETALAKALDRVSEVRAHEAALIRAEIRARLGSLRAAEGAALRSLREEQARQRRRFDEGLNEVLEALEAEMRAVLDVPGPDESRVPDTAGDRFRMTAGKRERARLQIAYSKACIRISAFLTGHGVIELPSTQQTAVASLNTVLVAVMGVSVKYRADLRRIFCETPGRQRLLREFAHYHEQSSDRVELASRIAAAHAGVAAADKALAALGGIEAAR